MAMTIYNLLAISLALILIQSNKCHGAQQKMTRLPSKSECTTLAADGDNCRTPEMEQYCRKACDLQHQQSHQYGYTFTKSFYELNANNIEGKQIDFEKFRGKVVLVTNVASYCGRTERHYNELNELYAKYGTNDFEILAFPSNQFGAQEPDSNAQIAGFCQANGVQFQMMDKVDVNGSGMHNVYKFLKQKAGPVRIAWNFGSYYLIGRDGQLEGFHDGTTPLGIEEEIAAALDA